MDHPTKTTKYLTLRPDDLEDNVWVEIPENEFLALPKQANRVKVTRITQPINRNEFGIPNKITIQAPDLCWAELYDLVKLLGAY